MKYERFFVDMHTCRTIQLVSLREPRSQSDFLLLRAVHLVSPSGRDVAQRQRGLAPSLRELACRLAARLREQPIICHVSGYLLRRPARVLLLPSRLAPCHLPQRGRLWFYAQSKLVSLGEPRSRCELFLISPAHIPLLFSARCGIFPCSRQCRTRRPATRRRPPPVQIGW